MIGEELIFQGLALQSFFTFLTVLIIIVAISGAVSSANKKRKSQDYRKLVVDMYVAAKTRALAEEDNLDLELEEKAFNVWRKKQRIRNSDYDLDNTIEEELKEKVGEKFTEESESKKKKETKTKKD